MPLSYTGHETPTASGENRRAEDQNGKIVIVSASTDAIQDHGWDSIWSVASDKYDADDVDRAGLKPVVKISTIDFENLEDGPARAAVRRDPEAP